MCISSSTIVTFLYTCHTDRQLLGCTANSVVAYRPMCSLDHNEHNERLNPSKTVMIWLGSKYQVDRVGVHAVPVLTSTVPIVDSARALGVVLDSRLTMAAHVGSVYRSAYYQLRHLRPVMRSLSLAFMSSRLDYCNSTSPTACFGDYKPFKMPPHALSLACSVRTTSLRSYSSFIGSRSANESSSSMPCCFQGVARSVAAVSRG